MEQVGLASLRDPAGHARTAAGAPGRGAHRYGDSLSGAAAPAESLRQAGPESGRLPRGGAGGRRNRLAAYVSRTSVGAAEAGGGAGAGVCVALPGGRNGGGGRRERLDLVGMKMPDE